MFKSPKKSTKKNDLTDILSRVMLDIEYAAKKLVQELKRYKIEFTKLTQALEQIETVFQKQETFKSSELQKAFSSVKTGISRLNKEIESSQKHLQKAELDFEKKLHTPFDNGNFGDQDPTILAEAKVNIAKIQETLQANKLDLDEIIDTGQILAARTAALEEGVHKICLPDELSEAAKINHKLNDCMELLCQETASLHLNEGVDKTDAEKIAACMLQLYAAHKKGEKLLDQIQKNLQPVDIASINSGLGAKEKEDPIPRH